MMWGWCKWWLRISGRCDVTVGVEGVNSAIEKIITELFAKASVKMGYRHKLTSCLHPLVAIVVVT